MAPTPELTIAVEGSKLFLTFHRRVEEDISQKTRDRQGTLSQAPHPEQRAWSLRSEFCAAAAPGCVDWAPRLTGKASRFPSASRDP